MQGEHKGLNGQSLGRNWISFLRTYGKGSLHCHGALVALGQSRVESIPGYKFRERRTGSQKMKNSLFTYGWKRAPSAGGAYSWGMGRLVILRDAKGSGRKRKQDDPDQRDEGCAISAPLTFTIGLGRSCAGSTTTCFTF